MKLRHIIVFFFLALGSRESMAATDSILVTVDTLCDRWKVHVKDLIDSRGIKRITLNPIYSDNFVLDPVSDTDRNGVIEFDLMPKQVYFELLKINSKFTASAVINIDHRTGELSSRVLNSLIDDGRKVTYSPPLTDKYDFGTSVFKSSKLKKFRIVNEESSQKSLVVNDIWLESPSSNFSLSDISKPLPYILKQGDTITYTVSFNANIIYDTKNRVILDVECYKVDIPLEGHVLTGVIDVDDLDYGELFIGEKKCLDLMVKNIGNNWFTLNDVSPLKSTTDDITNLHINDPHLVEVGGAIVFVLCYNPTKVGNDSVVLHWENSIAPELEMYMKNTSVIRGVSSIAEVKWVKSLLRFQADSTQSQFFTTIFHNHAPAGTFVKRFYISGKDSAEFEIFNSLSPLSNVTMLRNETDWFDIAFKPDMTKPLAERYADRHATLVAELADSNVTMELIGTFNPLHVKHEFALDNISFSPNPVYGQDATLSFTLAEPKQLAISIYDILGREVISIPSQHYSSGSYSNVIGTSKLSDGSYILRVSDGVLTKSISFRVVK
jgi:hypothetical protein